MTDKFKKTLHLCYFGLREPLVQTQVLPYLREISGSGIRVFLLTFEPRPNENWTPQQIEAEKKTLAAAGIEWVFLTYHKSPSAPATLFDILNGAKTARRLVKKYQIEIVHARSHVALAMGLLVKRLTGCRLIFDLRGLMAEEYVDAGVWRTDSPPFKAIKKIERRGLQTAEKVVVLTEKMRDYLIKNSWRQHENIEVIPCCVDFSRANSNRTTKKNSRFELIYAGSVTGLYMLEEMGRFFMHLKTEKPDAFFRILTTSPAENVVKAFTRLGIEEADYEVRKVSPGEVLNFMQHAHLAISFRKPTFSQIAASPTKIPEYLAAGLSVVANQGIGDMDALLENKMVGVVVKDFSDAQLSQAVKKSVELLLDNSLRLRCRQTALENFDLKTVGKEGYLNVYKTL